ncbi:MAG: multicopper oxidase domain-containing protein [Marivibrio sp.]|uniref:multicopper oxidase family protein n=1 Tax=Marivibrio sp. TaxID=2039719 RepID=UPI0032EE4A0F
MIRLVAGVFGAALGLVAFIVQPAVAKPGCAYAPIDLSTYAGKPFAAPSEIVASRNGVLEADLRVAYDHYTIADCAVRLRTYNGALVGPTLRVKPGDVLRVRLVNDLPPNKPHHAHDPNVPHGFNTTNLHTHGLWVSPLGNGDNVTLKIEPGTAFDYEIEIPEDHAPGTFWYHAHVHGSTALQVSSGMAGLIVIEGGLDEVPSIAPAAEKLMVFQQIGYDENGEIENYDGFGPGTWAKSHRMTTINGQIVPEIVMTGGEVQRWRMVHAGVRETISPTLRRFRAGDAADRGGVPLGSMLNDLSAEALNALPRAVPLHEIAADGLAFGRVDRWDAIQLQPGYRSDVMVKAPANGAEGAQIYLLTDEALFSDAALLQEAEQERLLAIVRVLPGDRDMALPTTREVAPYLAHPWIADDEIDPAGAQSVVFNLDNRVCDATGKCEPATCDPSRDANCRFRFLISDRTYSDFYSRSLKLGTAAEWTLSSKRASHPFHIHVNPFEVTQILPDGREGKIWKDTLFIREGEPPVTVRTRYERFIGTFVIHCHILDHEDQGMMELVTILP